MTIEQISSSNTFIRWVGKTQELAIRVPEFIDSFEGPATVLPNTNINIAYDVNVGGNVLVTGNFILVDSVYDDLDVAGNIVVDGPVTTKNAEFSNVSVVNELSLPSNFTINNISTTDFNVNELDVDTLNAYDLVAINSFDISAANLTVENAEISQNIAFVNTSATEIGTNAIVYNFLDVDNFLVTPNLNVTELTVNNIDLSNLSIANDTTIPNDLNSVTNLTISGDVTSNSETANLVSVQNLSVTGNTNDLNITNNLEVGTDANIYGNLTVSNDFSISNLEIFGGNYLNIENANITNLIGAANTNIYNTIDASTAAVTVAANISAFTGFVLALG
jgi:hypothetical protein